MNAFNYLIAFTIFLTGFLSLNSDSISEKKRCVEKDTIPSVQSVSQKHPFFSKVYLSKSDAEKILGEKVYLTDSSATVKKDTLELKKAYRTNSKELKTGRTGNIYFMLEEYSQLSSAKMAYQKIKTSNVKHKGIEILKGMGDEAYFHSDRESFCFILVRKERKMFRMKVNKITRTTAVEEFKRIAKKIADNL